MSLLTHQSFASVDVPYWASATKPTSLVSPLSVVDTYGVPTKKVTVTANANGTGGVFYSGSGGGNPFGMAFAQGVTQPGNQLILDVGNVNPALVVTSSNVVSSLPIVIDSPLNAQDFTIVPTPGGVELQMGTPASGGSVIAMTNAPSGLVTVMGATTLTQTNIVFADKFNNDTTINEKQVQFGNSAGNVAQVGITGSSAYLGTLTAPLTTPGVLVNLSNGCELQFADSTNLYGMKSTGGILTISAPSDPAAITVAPTGAVTIPNIISGSFVPIGGIVMFSGVVAALPTNWKLCDGTSGTPDLRGLFVIGAGGTFAIGATGGSTDITISNLPNHAHAITDPGHSHTVYSATSTDTATATGGTFFAKDLNTITSSTSTTGITKTQGYLVNSNAPSNIVPGNSAPYYPPYYALAYIIRVA